MQAPQPAWCHPENWRQNDLATLRDSTHGHPTDMIGNDADLDVKLAISMQPHCHARDELGIVLCNMTVQQMFVADEWMLRDNA